MSSIFRWFETRTPPPRRFIIDEAHKILTEVKLRPAFRAICRLAPLAVQIGFLSASLPVQYEQAFLKAVGLPSTTAIIRASTARPNLAYHVLTVDIKKKAIEDVALELAALVQSSPEFVSASRGIIYCRSRVMTESLGPHFADCISHSLLSEDVRRSNQLRWVSGESQWIVATSGFIHGIDYLHVRTVIFVDEPHTLFDLVQGSGRAGRDGLPCSTYLIRAPSSSVRHAKRPKVDDVHGKELVDQWSTNTTVCRRCGLAHVMDGLDAASDEVTCSQLKNALSCDVCAPDSPSAQLGRRALSTDRRPLPASSVPDPALPSAPPASTQDSEALYDSIFDETLIAQVDISTLTSAPTQPSTLPIAVQPVPAPSPSPPCASNPEMRASLMLDAALNTQQKRVLNAKVEQMSALLHHTHGKCVVCWAWKSVHVPKGPSHKPFVTCVPPGERFTASYGWIGFKKRIALTAMHYCFRCGFPQEPFRPDPHPQFARGENIICDWDDTVAHILWFVLHDPPTWTRAIAFFGEDALKHNMNLDAFVAWVNKDDTSGTFYNGLELVLWFWNSWLEQRPH